DPPAARRPQPRSQSRCEPGRCRAAAHPRGGTAARPPLPDCVADARRNQVVMRRRTRLLILAVVLGATAIAIARSDPAEIWRAMKEMSWRWAAVAALLNLAGVVIDASRLRVIVSAVGRVRFLHVVQAQLVGIVGNVLFPFKLGEGARAYVLARH